jgi:hypothetical protein
MRAFDRDLIRGGHYGQRSCEPRSKAEHMAAPTKLCDVKILLANSEPSTHGTKQSCADALFGSALRRIAEAPWTLSRRANREPPEVTRAAHHLPANTF